jgi:hypothetical protein
MILYTCPKQEELQNSYVEAASCVEFEIINEAALNLLGIDELS